MLRDAGVASAAVNAVQQIGGLRGPALVGTVAASALTGYLAANAGRDAEAAVHSYSVIFVIAAAVLLSGAIAGGLLLRPRKAADDAPRAP